MLKSCPGEHEYETAVRDKNGFSAWCKVREVLESVTPIFGILKYLLRFASIRVLYDSMFDSRSRKLQ